MIYRNTRTQPSIEMAEGSLSSAKWPILREKETCEDDWPVLGSSMTTQASTRCTVPLENICLSTKSVVTYKEERRTRKNLTLLTFGEVHMVVKPKKEGKLSNPIPGHDVPVLEKESKLKKLPTDDEPKAPAFQGSKKKSLYYQKLKLTPSTSMAEPSTKQNQKMKGSGNQYKTR